MNSLNKKPDRKPSQSPVPSATIILLRNQTSFATSALEVLLLKRNPAIKHHGGAWLFPGGKLEIVDIPLNSAPADVNPTEYFSSLDRATAEAALRRTACRETREEAGLMLKEKDLTLCARWLTPPGLPKRFDTYFYYANMPTQDVNVDGQEITDYQWLTISNALEKHHQGQLPLPPPTYVSLQQLKQFSCREDVFKTSHKPAPFFEPRWVQTKSGFCTLYKEDAAYQSLNLNNRSHQHRLVMSHGIYEYLKD